jgi:enoyl-CoA hydratase/carnithine racemase
MDDDILYRVEDNVAWITINQPEKMNRLTFQAMAELVKKVERAGDDEAVKVLVITGAGEKAFCAGASIDQFEQDSILVSKKNLDAYARICKVFSTVGKPSIAMVNGYAMAGGCGLAMLPAFGIASEKALFACPEIKVGVWPMMVMAILFRTVGRKKGLELICTGETIDAHEAERIGMINKAVPHEELKTHVEDLAGKLKSKSSAMLRLGLEAFHNSADMEYHKAVSYLRDMAVIMSHTPDAVEGTRAFMEKRKPKWNNR